jgi:osmotically-inducible protein OsmY
MIRYTFYLLPVVMLLLSGCSGLGMVTGAAAVTGIAAAQEGGLSRATSDAVIKLKINEAWFQYDVEAFQKLSTTVNQGRVLITGVVQNPEHRVEAVRLAWQVDNVKQVINEIRVAQSEGVKGFVRDGWITSRLRGSLTLDREVQSINYSIDTVQGIVYLMGVAQNQQELNHVLETARTISGVKKVVSYVKLAGEPLDQAEPAAAQPVDIQPVQSQPVYNETNSNLKTVPSEDDVDVPAKIVPEDAPSIEDQYYNS